MDVIYSLLREIVKEIVCTYYAKPQSDCATCLLVCPCTTLLLGYLCYNK